MKIGILSDCRTPTKAVGGHGLGRVAVDIAKGLKARGHDITLFAGYGSAWDGKLVVHADEHGRAQMLADDRHMCVDAFIDLSHDHDLSRLAPDLNVLDYVMDLELKTQPKKLIVGSEFMKKQYPFAVGIVPLGIDVDAIPAGGSRTAPTLVYMAKLHPLKGFDIARDVGIKTGRPVAFYGENFVGEMASGLDWRGVIEDDAKLFATLGASAALLSPSRYDAGGRINLEAAACGTPVLCLDCTGVVSHVEHCVSGFICKDADEMADAVKDLDWLDPAKMRAWVADTHGMKTMIDAIEGLL